jgi:TPP-dependent indolepyruvate ferredoxin oxidoreductase alpha subunit
MQRGYQKGSLKVFRGNYVGQGWQGGHRKSRVLGPVSKMTKSKARLALAAIIASVNNSLVRTHQGSARVVYSITRDELQDLSDRKAGQCSGGPTKADFSNHREGKRESFYKHLGPTGRSAKEPGFDIGCATNLLVEWTIQQHDSPKTVPIVH